LLEVTCWRSSVRSPWVLGNTRLRARALDGASLASCVSVCECFRLRVPAARVSLGSDKGP
jgi:hypothetical protein